MIMLCGLIMCIVGSFWHERIRYNFYTPVQDFVVMLLLLGGLGAMGVSGAILIYTYLP